MTMVIMVMMLLLLMLRFTSCKRLLKITVTSERSCLRALSQAGMSGPGTAPDPVQAASGSTRTVCWLWLCSLDAERQ